MVERRDPGIVLVLAIFTCGLYLIYWYAQVYEELRSLAGETPTGQEFWLDFLLVVVTCTIYGIWVDYKISLQLNELQARRGMQNAMDSTTLAVILDVAAFVTSYLTNFVTSAIQQDQLNKIVQYGAGPAIGTPVAPPPPVG